MIQQDNPYKEGMIFDERFQLNKFIGQGAFGEVWQATDQWTKLDVAIKIYKALNEQDSSSFLKEFQVAFELNHSNLLHATHLSICKNENNQSPYLVMPYCPEGSVAKLTGRMKEEQMWEFIADVASGLAYLHRQHPSIIHQDIKPGNILIAKTGEYVITDFGISLQLRKTLTNTSGRLTSAGSIAYMGPERWSRYPKPVKASDIWSLGATIYELIVGDLPFCGEGGRMLKSGAEMPDLPEEFSQELNMVMQSCLALETWDRPTAEQLADYARKKTKGESPKPTWNVPVEEPAVTPAKPVQPKTPTQKKEKKVDNGRKKKQIKKKDNEWISWVILIVAALAMGAVAAWIITMKQ